MAQSNQDEGGQMKVENVSRRSVTAVTQALKGISFPTTKAAAVEFAKQRDAVHPETIEVLEKLPEGTYEQMADVMHNMGRVV